MNYISTSGQSPAVSFLEAAAQGLAPDGGLYMPEMIPVLPQSFWQQEGRPTIRETGALISEQFMGSDAGVDHKKLVEDAINFEAPLKELGDSLFLLKLFHGPTLAFKDFGARYMARVFATPAFPGEGDVTILVATSGDTGGAVADGFFDVPGVNVCLLYPKGKVSGIQRKQMTTLGKNITALEVNGNFDDCQRLVKTAFSDKELNKKIRLSSANSINIARLVPQSFYYADAWFQLKQFTNHNPVFTVPSGNFGNLTAGLLANKMGMPVKQFIAATNSNDVVPRFLSGETFKPKPSVQTISNAMDVGSPSNFERILHLYNRNEEQIRKEILGASFSDDKTRAAIKRVFEETGVTFDPHTAVGILAAEKYRHETGNKTHPVVVLATAHPSKFKDVVEQQTGQPVQIPPRLAGALEKEEQSIPIGRKFEELREFLDSPLPAEHS